MYVSTWIFAYISLACSSSSAAIIKSKRMMRVADRFWNSCVHSRDRLRRLSARSLHTWMPSRINDCSVQSGRQVGAKKREGKKKSSISHNGVSGSIPPRTSNETAGGSRPGLVGFPSYAPIARRFVARTEKVRPEAENHDFRVRHRRQPSTFVVGGAEPGGLLFRRQWSAKPIGRTLTIAPRSIAISVARISESEA